MDVAGISGATSTQENGFASISSEEFVKILVEELQNQDPFNPQDTTALLEQLSSLRNIESDTLLGDRIEEMVRQNQVSSAGNLIGKVVAGIDTLNANTSGLVTSVRVTSEGVFLELDSGRSMHVDQVQQISELDAA